MEQTVNVTSGNGTRSKLPSLVAIVGILVAGVPWFTDNLYRNYYLGAGLLFLFAAWIVANFQNKERLEQQGRWKDQTKAMIAMGMCMTLGLGMLMYYEAQMPKYRVAITDKELYKVPPQLNKKQLIEMGAECNTYGDTLCSHAVFAKIIKLDPRDYFALANLAMAQSHLGFHEYAVTNFENAINKGVKKYDVYKFYGNSLLALGRREKAIKAYSASLVKNPYQEDLRKKVRKLAEKQ